MKNSQNIHHFYIWIFTREKNNSRLCGKSCSKRKKCKTLKSIFEIAVKWENLWAVCENIQIGSSSSSPFRRFVISELFCCNCGMCVRSSWKVWKLSWRHAMIFLTYVRLGFPIDDWSWRHWIFSLIYLQPKLLHITNTIAHLSFFITLGSFFSSFNPTRKKKWKKWSEKKSVKEFANT